MTWATFLGPREDDPANLVLAGEGGTIYVASPERHAVLAVDAATRAVRASAPGFQQPGGLALLHDATLGDRLFAADTLAGTVRVLDAGDLRTLAETAVGPGPYALVAAPEAGHVFAALSGGDEVAMLDARGTLLTTTRLGGLGFPQGLAVDPIGWPRLRQLCPLAALRPDRRAGRRDRRHRRDHSAHAGSSADRRRTVDDHPSRRRSGRPPAAGRHRPGCPDLRS